MVISIKQKRIILINKLNVTATTGVVSKKQNYINLLKNVHCIAVVFFYEKKKQTEPTQIRWPNALDR